MLPTRPLDEGELADRISAARRIFLAGTCGFPAAIVDVLDRRPELLEGRQVVCAVAPGFGHSLPAATGARYEVFFGGRDLASRPEVRFVPIQYRRLWDRILRDRFDLALVRVVRSRSGAIHFGMGVDFQPAALAAARQTVLEIADGDPLVEDAPVPTTTSAVGWYEGRPVRPLAEPGEPDPVTAPIGGHVASLVRDGDCLQLGVGAVPDAVLSRLHGHRGLGCHSGMISDGVMRLVESGALDGSRKTLDEGRVVSGFVVGSRALLDWASSGGTVALRPVSYTHDARVLARQRQLVAVNSAVEVDLTGQVNAEQVGGVQVSGTGGSVDFARGAGLSEGGRSIVALPSTARGGTVSRIVHRLAAGTAVTLARTDVDYVVTEHGVAHLAGADLGERARRLVAVADPRFREDLEREAHRSSSAD